MTRDLVEELSKAGIPALDVVKGGAFPGVFGVYEMVYAYAMWISAAFCVKVIRGYHASVTGGALPAGAVGSAPLSVPAAMAAQRQVQRLLAAVLEAKNAAIRRVSYGLLASNLRVLGEPVPTLEDLVLDRDPTQPGLPL